ncbi:unnamed protein product [Lota lota]
MSLPAGEVRCVVRNYCAAPSRGMTDRQERRVVYFASGETMEEEEEEEEDPTHDTLRDPSERTWRSWRKTGVLVMRMSLRACDFLGERLAGFLGLDAAKYQYAIDEHHRNRQISEDLSEAKGEKAVLSTRLDRTYSATEPRTQLDSGQGSLNAAYQHDRDH